MIWRLDAAESVGFQGILWRMLSPCWSFDPLSGAGAARSGGRWNASGQRALYFSDSRATAIAEYHQDLPRPGTLTGYEVQAGSLLDLTDASIRDAIGLESRLLLDPWKQVRDIDRKRPMCRDFAVDAADHGWLGLEVRSVQAPGINIVLWRWNLPDGPVVRVIDPIKDPPKDQASWPI